MAENKATTFSGISLAEAKRMVDYEFTDCVIKIERNNAAHAYEVHILDNIEKKVIEKFKAYWKKTFIIKVYALKYEL